MPHRRVVSLIASSTEIVCALGKGEWLVGRSHECDFPPWVRDLPVCTKPKFPVDGTSRDIDERVKGAISGSSVDALSVYSVDTPLLNDLRPEVILTQSQCEVCAVSLKDVERALCSMVSSRPEIVSLEPHRLDDVWTDIRRVALALNVIDEGERLVGTLQDRLVTIAEMVSGQDPPTVACIEWIDPLMASGNWMPELVGIAGGHNLFGVAGAHSPWMTWTDLCENDPDVIVVAPCGFDLGKTREEIHWLSEKHGWDDLSAVRTKRVYIADGNQFFNRPGPRLVESVEILAEMFFPGTASFGREGTGWERIG